MSSDWQRVRSIFERAVELDGEAREAWLKQACGDDAALLAKVRDLLALDAEGDSVMDAGARAALGQETVEAVPTVTDGERIGPYRLLERIGEGGMGEVWLAEQREPVRRRVAVKIIRRGMDSDRIVARFEAERQALVLMEHATIATVFDAGTTPNGRPYFAMEYVAGVPITEHCDRERLTTQQRIELFLQVCEGVQHAHQKGVIHRDLKPTNVLVAMQGDTAVPKIIDFGVAKATQQRLTEQTVYTELGVLIGTPEYMSPEQADLTSQDIDTRSDVYALGVLLYELLVGALPFDSKELRKAGFDEIRRRIREVDPPTPSTRIATLQGTTTVETAAARRTEPRLLKRQLRGDLDWITMRALEKERARRYGSPSELAADLKRHLDDEPVLAGPPGAAYRAGKFIRRHRLAVAAASIVLVSLVVFAATLAVQATRIAAQRNELAASTARLERVVAFQTEQLSSVDPQQMGLQLRDSLVEARRVGPAPESDPAEVEAVLEELRRQLAPINFTDIAVETLERNVLEPALASIDTGFTEDPVLRAELLQSVASTLFALGMFGQAEAPQSEALALRREWLGDLHPDTLASTLKAARHIAKIRQNEVAPLLQEAAEGLARVRGASHPETLDARIGLALSQNNVALASEVVETGESVLGPEDPRVIDWRGKLAFCAFDAGNVSMAMHHSRKAYEDAVRALGPEHPATKRAMGSLAGTLWKAGEAEEAEPLMRELWERSRVARGDGHERTIGSALNLAAVLESRNKLEEAERLVRDVLESAQSSLVSGNETLSLARHNLGYLLYIRGSYEQAESHLRTALEERVLARGNRARNSIATRGNLAMVLARAGKADEAESLAREAIGHGVAALGAKHQIVGQCRGQLGLALTAQGRHGEAERELLEAHRVLTAALGESHERTRRVAGYLVELYEDRDGVEPGF